jgi:ectoine hydroxylase-related dioxygenase (phytanoyl-CoA dioxygenase family)
MPRSALSDQQHDRFDSEGFVVVEQLFDRFEIAHIRDTFMDMNRNGPVEGLSEIRRGRVDGTVGGYDVQDPLAFYPRMMHPHKHPDKPVGPLAMAYMTHPRLKPILANLFAEEPYAVQSMFYFKPPGARGQALHQDNFYLKVKPGTCMAAWMAIDDADEENGGMMCVPNTNMLDIACPDKADPSLYFTTEHVEPPAGLRPRQLRLKAGDVLFFNGNVIHGSPPNTSRDRFRRSLICHYVPASTAEMSSYYEVYNFAGERQKVVANNDGGPCGTPQDRASGPH